jgi:ribonuclease BN (tRNA processing enzyme)
MAMKTQIPGSGFAPRAWLAACLLVVAAGAMAEPSAHCDSTDGVTLQVLGSGGPIADDDRASASYLVRVDGKARIMIDAGTGGVLRFAQAGARIEDLDFVGLSHFHTDHSADFPALLKSGNFSGRSRSLAIAGPGGNARFPGLDEWLERLFDPDTGAYRYLSGYLDGTRGLPALSPVVVAADTDKPTQVYASDETDLDVQALPVPHGIVPALAFRVAVRGRVFVFGSDQTMASPGFVDFARGADLLVAHMAIPEGATGTATQLHALPGAIGAAADAAGARALLLSHFMARSLRRLDDNVAAVEARYDGRVLLAEDLACYSMD